MLFELDEGYEPEVLMEQHSEYYLSRHELEGAKKDSHEILRMPIGIIDSITVSPLYPRKGYYGARPYMHT